MLKKLTTVAAVLVLLTLLAAPLVLAQTENGTVDPNPEAHLGPDATQYSLPAPDGSCPAGESSFVLWSYPGNPDNGKTVCGSLDAAYLSKLTFYDRCGPQQVPAVSADDPPGPPPPCAFGYPGSGTIDTGMQQYSPSPFQPGGR